MWIREIESNYIDKGDAYTDLNLLWKSDFAPIYIMDNHLAATWCWMQECNPNEKYNFMHIDKHSDLKGCGYTENIEFLRVTPKISFIDYEKITYFNHEEYQFFQWDNYIRACHFLFPNWFNTNFFYTQEDNLSFANDWGYVAFPSQTLEALCVRQGITQYIKEQKTLTNDVVIDKNMWKKKWIVNIDLDFFWDFDGIKVFDDQFIMDLGKRISKAMSNIQVLTIALSPSCCRSWDNAIDCSKVFLHNSIFMKSCEEYLENKILFPNDSRGRSRES